MAKNRETATSFTLEYLSKHHDREMRLADLVPGCEGRFSAQNIQQSLVRLLERGQVVRSKDGHEAWWAIGSGLFAANDKMPEPVESERKVAAPKIVQPVRVNVIRSGRY